MANKFSNQLTPDVGTTSEIVYATDANTVSTVIGINIANKTAGTIYASIILEGADSTETYLVKDVVIPRGSSLAAMGGDQKLVMTENNTLSVSTTAANGADVIVSVLEIV
jgi:hypothetical protein